MRQTNPVIFKAILRAIEAILDSQLQAGRALQRPSVFLAIRSQAFYLRLAFGCGLHSRSMERKNVALGNGS
jgi:hypothetical protein